MPYYTNFLGLYKPSRNDNLAMDTTLADNFSSIDSKLGSSLTDEKGVTFLTLKERLASIAVDTSIEGIALASEYNLIGDGSTDDHEELQKMFNDSEGKVLHLEYGKTYGIASGYTVFIKSNTTVISHGAKFKKLSTGTTYPLELSGVNIWVDNITLVPFGTFNDVGLKITGTQIFIETVDITTDIANVGGNAIDFNGLFISNALYVTIGTIKAKNWERTVQIASSQHITIGYFDIEFFSLAVYLNDVKYFRSYGAHIRKKSSQADGDAGENSILIESKSHYASEDIYIANWLAEETGEHGYRLGGGYTISRVTFDNCTAKETGQGRNGNGTTEAGVGHGGCGFKVLGPTINGGYHRDITFNNCKAINGRDDILDGSLNFAGFYIGKCKNVTINSPTVDTDKVSTSARSWVNGIEIIGSEEVNINNPNIHYVNNHSIHIQDYQQDGYDWGSLISRIVINGGILATPLKNNVNVEAHYYTFRRLVVNNVLLEGGENSIKAIKDGTGDYLTCFASGYISIAPSQFSLDLTNEWIAQMSGIFTSSVNPCSDGSTFSSTAGFKIRKGGVWVDY